MEQFVLFLFGMCGALLTVYLTKQNFIPEFPWFFDVADKEIEAAEHREHIKKTEKEIDSHQAKLEKSSLTQDDVARLTILLESSQDELSKERERLQMLEPEIKQNQFRSRSIGFLVYIVLGGVFGTVLAEMVQITGGSSSLLEGTENILPNSFKAIIIGATWTSYLSIFGFKIGQEKASEIIEAAKKVSAETNETLKKEISEQLTETVTKALRSTIVGQARQSKLVNDLDKVLNTKIDQTNLETQEKFDLTRSMVKRVL